MEPILSAIVETDSRLRYFACESLYNVTKVVRTQLIPGNQLENQPEAEFQGHISDQFVPLFTSISRLTSDSDQNVRSGAELLDRLLKDVVSESETAPNIGSLIRERIYAKEATARLFVSGWIILLTGNPAAGFGEVLPAIIDGLFRSLDDTNINVQRQISNALQASLQETSRSDISQLLPIVAEQLNISGGKNNWQLRYNTLLWLRHLIPINNEITVKSAGVCIRAIFKIKTDEVSEMKEAQRNAEINELKNDVQILLKRAILEKAESDELKSILQVLLSILDTDPTARLSCFNWLDTILEKSIAEDEIILYLPGEQSSIVQYYGSCCMSHALHVILCYSKERFHVFGILHGSSCQCENRNLS